MKALLRGVPDSYQQATRREGAPIDVSRARQQHAAYRAALVACGAVVEVLAADEGCPDGIFVEDTAVIAGGRALITRSAHAGRDAERPSIAAALARHGLEVVAMGPGSCDGGDVMIVGSRLYAGLSDRTDAAGVASLAALGLPVTAVALPSGVLHLKCVCSPLSDDEVLLAEGTLDPKIFSGLRLHRVPAAEAWAANVVALGRRVVLGSGYPRAADVVAAAGYEPHLVEADQIRAGDGAMTCLSLRW